MIHFSSASNSICGVNFEAAVADLASILFFVDENRENRLLSLIELHLCALLKLGISFVVYFQKSCFEYKFYIKRGLYVDGQSWLLKIISRGEEPNHSISSLQPNTGT